MDIEPRQLDVLFVIDIDNTIADMNREIEQAGYGIDTYPAPIDKSFFTKKNVLLKTKPINNVIDHIHMMMSEYTYDHEKVPILFLTSRDNNKNVLNWTLKWLLENTRFHNGGISFANGKRKADYLCDEFITKPDPNSTYELFIGNKVGINKFIIYEDAPHELESYIALRDEKGIDMELFIPEWAYNKHIDGVKIKTRG